MNGCVGRLQVQGVTEQHEADPLAMPRPKRRERFPTEYKAPSAVLTPLERELLMGSGTSSQPSAAEERPAGPMQPPRATVMEERPVGLVYPPQATANQEQPPNLMQPPRFAAAADRPAGVMQVQPPQAHVTLGHAFPTGSPTSWGCNRTLCSPFMANWERSVALIKLNLLVHMSVICLSRCRNSLQLLCCHLYFDQSIQQEKLCHVLPTGVEGCGLENLLAGRIDTWSKS